MTGFDEHFLKKVFYKHYDRVFNNFLQKTSSFDVAKDLAQVTFIKFWEYRDTYNPELSDEIQLNRKAKLVFIDWLRKEAHQRKLIKEIEKFDAVEVRPGKFELTDSLKKAIDQLPAVRKKVFLLSYIDGYSHKEIAEQLNISTRTVESHIFKAVQQLRKILAFFVIASLIVD
ncbi:MAG: hypothetical protein BGN92_04965 [Sphingobacteriales bacterium 41-5]|nr:MAG: hypothetical protein BGN92_04965 [Sphingobacteriales bacterium 41-5]